VASDSLMHTASPTLDKVCTSPCTLANSLPSHRIKTAARGPGQLFCITKPCSMHQDPVTIGVAYSLSPAIPNPSSLRAEVPTTSAELTHPSCGFSYPIRARLFLAVALGSASPEDPFNLNWSADVWLISSLSITIEPRGRPFTARAAEVMHLQLRSIGCIRFLAMLIFRLTRLLPIRLGCGVWR
jgi:hypothetical protein